MPFRALRRLAVLALASLALAQGPGRMTVFPLGTDQGLPEGRVEALIQDREGRYWAAAEHGLYAGDGATFLKTSCAAPEERPQFRAVAEDRLGRIAALGEAGFFLLEGGAWQRRDGGLPPRAAEDPLGLCRDGTGTLWLLWGSHLYRLDASARPVEIPLPAPGRPALSGRPLGPGLLARIGSRAWRWEEGAWRSLPDLPIRADEEFTGPLQEDDRGRLWTTTFQRILGLEPGAPAWRPLPDPAGPQGYAGGVWGLGEGEVWITGDRVARRADREADPITGSGAFSVYGLRLLLRDREGWLWGDRNGLHRIGGPWRIHSGEDGLPVAGFWQALRSPQGDLWVATTEGLYRSRGRRWERAWHGALRSQIAFGADGCLWAVESASGRLLRVPGHGPPGSLAPLPPELAGLAAVRGLCGTGGHLAFGTRDGRIFSGRWDGQWRWEAQPAPVSAKSLRGCTDAAGHIHFMGTGPGGEVLHSLDGGPWRPLPMAAGKLPTGLQWGADGVLEATQFSPPSLQRFRREGQDWRLAEQIDLGHFSPATAAYDLVRVSPHRLWIATDHGILELDDRQPTAARHFTTREGLPLDDCNQHGILVEPDRIWVSTGTGLASYDRRDEGFRPEAPGPVLLGARHDGNPWTLALRGPLPANLRALTLHLGLPSPTLKAHVRLQWRDLERGGEWQGFEGPALPFLDPSPGLHRIEVRGLQPGGQASPVWAGSFLIQWPWWRRPWALLLWTLLLGTLIFAVHRLRLERIQHRNRELAALVAERTAALAVSEAREREASQAKSTFLANMSHELRTPLNAILLYAELIHGDAEEAGHADLSRDSGRILSSGRHLLSLINGILDLSKIEAGKMTLDLEDLSLPALLADVAHTLAPLAEQKGVALGVTIPDPDLHLRTDGLKLKQVLLNLVGNAVKFTERGSVELVALREEGGLRLEVRDTGIGLTPDQVARIFNAYEQADRTTVAKAGGTGLGLTISQKFVSLLGGRIEVESEPGRGATFRVLLPLVPPAPGPERPAPPG